MRAAAMPTADPQLELHWLPDPDFLTQGFLIQCLHRRGRWGPACASTLWGALGELYPRIELHDP